MTVLTCFRIVYKDYSNHKIPFKSVIKQTCGLLKGLQHTLISKRKMQCFCLSEVKQLSADDLENVSDYNCIC